MDTLGEELTTAREAVSAELTVARERISKLECELKSMQFGAEDASTRIGSLEGRLEAETRMKTSAEERVVYLEAAIEKQKDDVSTSSAGLKSMQSGAEEAKSRMSSLETYLEVETRLKISAEERVTYLEAELEKQKDDARTSGAALAAKLGEALERVRALDAEAAHHGAELTAQKEGNIGMAESLRTREERIQVLEAEASSKTRAEELNAALKAELEQQEEVAAATGVELSEALERVHVLEACGAGTGDVADAKHDQQRQEFLQISLNEALERVRVLDAEAAEAINEKSQLVQQVADLKAMVGVRGSAAVAVEKTEIGKASQSDVEGASEIGMLHETIRALEKEVTWMEGALVKAQEKIAAKSDKKKASGAP